MFSTIEEVYQFFQQRKAFGIRLGLSRMEKMLDLLGRPERRLKAVHIAGTNGKGSTLAFLKGALRSNRYQVGTFTSPSMDRFNDHIHINDEAISDQSLIKIMNDLLPYINQLDEDGDFLTEYELVVIIAILYMNDKVDIALFETNMGGRDDSTNVITPVLSIITNIGLDHVRFLGNSYREIASHKAGIIKQNVPVITGELVDDAYEVIKKEAKGKDASLLKLNSHFFVENISVSENKTEVFSLIADTKRIENIELQMKGRHQVSNAALAWMGLLKLNDMGFELDWNDCKKGFFETIFPGRFEQIHVSPVVIIDSAHNQEGMDTFIDTVNRYFPNEVKSILFAAFKDKPLDKMIEKMDSSFQQITFTTFSHERAAPAIDLYNRSNHRNKEYTNHWQQVLKEFVTSGKNGEVLFITGSLHFISIVRKYFVK